MGEISKAISKILDQLAGPTAKELGEMLRDEIQPHRAARQLELIKKTVRMIQEAGFKPIQVSPKLLLKALEVGGLEEDEYLHTLWATLLANAANPDSAQEIHPSFPQILNQLAPRDAKFLDSLYEDSLKSTTLLHDLARPIPVPRHLGNRESLCETYSTTFSSATTYTFDSESESGVVSATYTEATLSLDLLKSLGLIETDVSRHTLPERFEPRYPQPSQEVYYLTARGLMFLRACRKPAMKEEKSRSAPSAKRRIPLGKQTPQATH